MEIYLLRHGIAEDHSETGRDFDRRLTDEGRGKLRNVLERAQAAGVLPSLILSSPLRRALETAEIAARELGYEGRIVRTDALAPDSAPEKVWAAIRDHSTEGAILLTGHNPLFSATAAHFLGSSREVINFRKGALLRIDFAATGTAARGILQWMLTAKVV